MSALLYTTDGEVILEIARMVCKLGIYGEPDDFERLLGQIAETESHARCCLNKHENADAEDLTEYYKLILKASECIIREKE